jgi:hypothetical protein
MTPPRVRYSSVPFPRAGPPPNPSLPPPTPNESCPPHLILFIQIHAQSFIFFFLFYVIVTTVYPPPPKTTSLDPKSRGAARGHRPSMPMTPVWTSISLGLFPMVERIHDDDIKKKKKQEKIEQLIKYSSHYFENSQQEKKEDTAVEEKYKINGLNIRRHYQCI